MHRLAALVERVTSPEDRAVLRGERPTQQLDSVWERALARARGQAPAGDVWTWSRLELLHRARTLNPAVLGAGLERWLDRVAEMRFGPALEGLEEARAAAAAIASVSPWLGSDRARRLARRALAIQGNAERIAGDLAAAEALLDAADDLAVAPDELGHTRSLQVSLLVDAGRLDEAAGLVGREIAAWRAAGRPDRVAHARLQRARIAGELDDVDSAVKGFARLLASDEADERVATLAAHNAAEVLARVGEFEASAAVLELAQPLYARNSEALGLELRRRWVEGRTACGLGDLGRAEQLLAGVRESFARESRPVDSARVGLDLCLVYAAAGRWPEIVRTARSAALSLRAAGVGPDAISALWLLRSAAREQVAEVARLAHVAAAIARAREQLR